MSSAVDIAKYRDQWLKTARKIVVASLQRSSLEGDMCPEFGEPDNSRELLKKHASLRVKISGLCEVLRTVEEEADSRIGLTAMLEKYPERASTVVATCLLVAKALYNEFIFKLTCIGDLCSLSVGNRDGSGLLAIRQEFASGGTLRPFVHVDVRGSTRTVDELGRPVLRESALSTLLCIEDDAEMKALDRARRSVTGEIRA